MNDAMNSNGLSEKEVALIAAARRQLSTGTARATFAPPSGTIQSDPPSPSRPVEPGFAPSFNPPAEPEIPDTITQIAPEPPATTDMATRMAMLMSAERAASEERKRRIKRNYMIAISAILILAFLAVITNLIKLLPLVI